MTFSKTAGLFFQFIKDALKELNSNLGLYLVYVVVLSLSTAIPSWINAYYTNNSMIIQVFAKLVFSLVPLLILSKIIYVVKIRNLGEGDYIRTFYSYFVYSILYLLLLIVAGIFIALPAYLVTLGRTPTLFGFSAVGLILIVYLGIYYSLTPTIAAIESETSDGFFRKSKKLARKNVWLILLYQFLSVFIYLMSAMLMLVKEQKTVLFLSTAFSIIDAIFTIVLTLIAVKIYFYLNEIE